MVQTQVTAQGWLGSTPAGRRPQVRLARWGRAGCRQLDPCHPVLATREDAGVEPRQTGFVPQRLFAVISPAIEVEEMENAYEGAEIKAT